MMINNDKTTPAERLAKELMRSCGLSQRQKIRMLRDRVELGISWPELAQALFNYRVDNV